jgi:hypothetical protein
MFKAFFLAIAVTLGTLSMAGEAQAWGAYHVGYTHVGPAGAYRVGATAAAGPYGGAYARVPGGGGYAGAYGYGGFRAGGAYGGAYAAGVYRRW